MQIRRAQKDDAAAISALILGEALHVTLHPDGFGAEEILDSMREGAIASNLASSRFAYWLACDGNTLLGVTSLRDCNHLYQMFVPTPQHGHGIARQLWQHLLNEMPAVSPPTCITVNASLFAVPIYERFGFKTTGPRTETKGIAFVPMTYPLSSPTSQEP